MKATRFFLLPALLLLVSCSDEKESRNVITDDAFVNFYVDFLIVQEENSIRSIDSLGALKRMDSIYQLHSVTPQQIEAARAEYNKDLSRWQSIYEKAIARMDSLQDVEKSN